MSYTTKQAMIDRFGETELAQLTDRLGASAIDETVLDAAIAHAGALIDSLLESRYPVPLDPVPVILADYASDIARWRLYEDAAPENVKERYENALRFLHDVRLRRASLGVVPPPAAAGSATFNDTPRIFGRELDY